MKKSGLRKAGLCLLLALSAVRAGFGQLVLPEVTCGDDLEVDDNFSVATPIRVAHFGYHNPRTSFLLQIRTVASLRRSCLAFSRTWLRYRTRLIVAWSGSSAARQRSVWPAAGHARQPLYLSWCRFLSVCCRVPPPWGSS
jgi:hypothetical protein